MRPDQQPRRAAAPRLLLICFFLGMLVVPVGAGAALYLALDGRLEAVGRLLNPPPLAPSTAEVPDWTGKGRLNLLLLGTDRRDGETSLARTDTIIAVTVDPESHAAGVLSLPRDLWVNVPGYGNDRINAAFELGEREKAGNGPQLARRTVEQLLGVPIHHYVLIGFAGFERLVNQIGGVVMDVERPLKDDEYPSENYGVRRIFIQPGVQRFDGETALWYVRSRHADSDFGRARRQQQFLLALRKQALQLNLLPKAPAMLAGLADSIQTDLRPQDVLSLARLAKDVDGAKVVNRVVDETMTTHWVTPAGAQVELPDKAALQRVAQEVFGAPKG